MNGYVLFDGYEVKPQVPLTTRFLGPFEGGGEMWAMDADPKPVAESCGARWLREVPIEGYWVPRVKRTLADPPMWFGLATVMNPGIPVEDLMMAWPEAQGFTIVESAVVPYGLLYELGTEDEEVVQSFLVELAEKPWCLAVEVPRLCREASYLSLLNV